MAATVPTVEPDFLFQGDTLTFQKSLTDYPATDGWSLSYYFVATDGSGKAFNFSASSSGNNFLVSTPTSGFEIGTYQGRAKVTKDGESFTVWQGTIEILPNLEQGGDLRSHARKTLDNIEAVIEGRANSTILDSTVNGTQLKRIPFSDLLDLQAVYKMKVRNEEVQAAIRAGKPTGRTVFNTFTRPK